jgi:hypothetical protein
MLLNQGLLKDGITAVSLHDLLAEILAAASGGSPDSACRRAALISSNTDDSNYFEPPRIYRFNINKL